jgi:hypothetical protein
MPCRPRRQKVFGIGRHVQKYFCEATEDLDFYTEIIQDNWQSGFSKKNHKQKSWTKEIFTHAASWNLHADHLLANNPKRIILYSRCKKNSTKQKQRGFLRSLESILRYFALRHKLKECMEEKSNGIDQTRRRWKWKWKWR